MKKKILVLLSLIYVCNVYSQEVEKLCELKEVKYIGYPAGLGGYPQGIYYEEVEDVLVTQDTYPGAIIEIDLTTKEIREERRTIPHYTLIKRLGNDYWGVSSRAIHPVIKNKSIPIIRNSTGISFILKKGEGYIVYYVHKDGTPGAVDTEGKIYSNREALEYLKECDVEKYEESLVRAEELGLKEDFEEGKVLIWGKTYYTTVEKILDFWIKDEEKYLYLDTSMVIQYDSQGNGYQIDFSVSETYGKAVIVSPKGERLIPPIRIYEKSTILKQKHEEDDFMGVSSSWYVGYGGNIYYYIAGEEYTEVFRIRRTWGNPDMYAMAINGYTEDNYGEYVKNTLATMSKVDLRLLRNTIFALYGVHFKSEDLSAHFAKEVWYTDEGKTSGEVDLPAHRKKLVEMIQEAERK